MRKKHLVLFCALLLASCASNSPSNNSSEGLGALPKAVGAANETSAIQLLRTIATAEAQLKSTQGSYGDFDTLVQGGLLDRRFAGASPTLDGYKFTIHASDSEFAANADPEASTLQANSAARHFYIDSSGDGLHANPSVPASRNDPIQ
jgi:hypothetical protein